MGDSGMTYAEARAALTGPGAPFELETEIVNGVEMQVFKQRFGSLREILVHSRQFGDAELAVWDTGVEVGRGVLVGPVVAVGKGVLVGSTSVMTVVGTGVSDGVGMTVSVAVGRGVGSPPSK